MENYQIGLRIMDGKIVSGPLKDFSQFTMSQPYEATTIARYFSNDNVVKMLWAIKMEAGAGTRSYALVTSHRYSGNGPHGIGRQPDNQRTLAGAAEVVLGVFVTHAASIVNSRIKGSKHKRLQLYLRKRMPLRGEDCLWLGVEGALFTWVQEIG
jgi:hypothetical protein